MMRKRVLIMGAAGRDQRHVLALDRPTEHRLGAVPGPARSLGPTTLRRPEGMEQVDSIVRSQRTCPLSGLTRTLPAIALEPPPRSAGAPRRQALGRPTG